MGARKYNLLGPTAAFAAAVSMQVACGDATSDQQPLRSEAVFVNVTNQPLMMGEVLALNGEYGAGCSGRSGAWSVAIGGDAEDLDHPALSILVEGDDLPCTITLTEVVAVGPVVYTATPALALEPDYAAAAVQFAADDPLGADAFYGNARLVAAGGAVTIELAFSDDPAFSEELVPASL